MSGYNMPTFTSGDPRDDKLVEVVRGLVDIHLLELRDPIRVAEALARREELADLLGSEGDRVLNHFAFRRKEDRQARRKLLNAMALTIALGVHAGGGVDWGGVHWCRVEHPDCPNKARMARAGAS